MILQALNDYYQRKTAEENSGLAPYGFERKELPFLLVLSDDGSLIEIEDTRSMEGKKAVGRSYVVPQGVKKTSGVAANLLWDNAEYVLGVDTRDKPERVVLQHRAFVDRLAADLGDCEDSGLSAVSRFLGELELAQLESFPVWEEIRSSNPNLSFRIRGESDLVCQHPAVVEALTAGPGKSEAAHICAVSGQAVEIERLHPAIKGVWGAQTSGANIVSFNLDAFTSFGKDQGGNAPVGKQAAFAYTTALNHLLRKGSRQRLQVGDASTVFWADKPTWFEEDFASFFGEPTKDNPDLNTDKVRSLLNAVNTGGYTEQDTTGFFILGLAPNAARIAVRFWQSGMVAELAPRIAQHFRDIEIVTSYEKDQPHPSNFRLLVNCAAQGKADHIPPNLGGEFMRAIVTGHAYPATLWQAAVRRNRAEQNVNYYRAALLKGCFNRQQRNHPFMEKEIAVSLDKENPNRGYRLGRLFATLEKIQQEAQGNINATIRDRFYGAASANPLSVFSNLMKLKNHHLSKPKIQEGRVRYFEGLIGEILSQVTEFPAQLTLQEQGLFAIGYYHQRQDFFTKKDDKE